FSPAQRVNSHYGERQLHYLIISHPDADHINGLPEMLYYLGKPTTFCRNRTLPDDEMHRYGQSDYQKLFWGLHSEYVNPVPADPCSPDINGGIEVWTAYLNWGLAQDINDSSVVCFYLFAGWLFVCPGDISPVGWSLFRAVYGAQIRDIVNRSDVRALVAPHHGRASGYSSEMMNDIRPNLVLISDKWGKEPTDQRFRTPPGRVIINGQETRFVSTKTSGRVQMRILPDGSRYIDYGEFS
ncbi:MAG: hypothetical protein PHR35_21980, partial [Kiritimatiellae bacterium]|nr:hypothetical protein [Kiritimatiellia bacterium]